MGCSARRLPSEAGNYAAAYDIIAVVKYHRLTGGYRPLRFIKAYMHRAVARRRDGGGLFCVTVAQLCRDADGAVERVERDEIDPICVKLAGIKPVAARQIYPIFLGADTSDVQRLGQRETESAALTDRVADDAAMPADRAAVGGNEITRGVGLSRARGDKIGIPPARNEADILRVAPLRDRESRICRELAHMRLCQLAEREEDMRQPVLIEQTEHIALILAAVGCTAEQITVAAALNARVVPGCELVRTEPEHLLKQGAEFYDPVAEHAGGWRFSVLVCRDEVGDDRFLELLGEIDGDVTDADRLCGRAGIGDIALRLCFTLALAMLTELHGRTEAVIALLAQQQRGDGGIYPAAHCYRRRFRRGCFG